MIFDTNDRILPCIKLYDSEKLVGIYLSMHLCDIYKPKNVKNPRYVFDKVSEKYNKELFFQLIRKGYQNEK